MDQQFIRTPYHFDEFLGEFQSATLFGFDTEFVGEETYRPELCLVQVATPERLYLLDPYAVGPLDRFWEIVADPARTAVVHAGREETRMCYFGIGKLPGNLFDLQIAAGLVGMTYPIGYAGLCQELLGARINKAETLTDWRRRPLSPAQELYAYDDVRFLLPAYRLLEQKLRNLGRTEWADEEFATFVKKATVDDPTVERWRKIKGLGSLDRRGLAVARGVYEWRDDRAEDLDRPPRTILRDEILAAIARRWPSSIEDLVELRGIARNDMQGILNAVREALALSVAQMPEAEERESDLPQVSLLANLLGVVLGEWSARYSIAANQLATVQELKNLVRARQPGGVNITTTPLHQGWRSRTILPELEAFLSGERSLSVGNARSQLPLLVSPNPREPRSS